MAWQRAGGGWRMSRFLLMMILVISLLLGIELRDGKGKPMIRIDRSPVVGGSNQFAIDLYNAIRSRPGNVSISPASVSTALAMTYEGAKGETAAEIARVFHFPADRDAMRAGFRELIDRMNGQGAERPYRLVAANSMWGQQDDRFLPEYTSCLARYYGSELHPVDFRHAAESAVRDINAWAKAKTSGLIPELLAPPQVRPDTSLILVNTVYFKGSWLHPFAKAATSPADFHLADGTTARVPMMHQTRRFALAAGDGFAMLELPYKGGDLAFDIVLPNEGLALDKVEADFSPAGLQNAIDRLGERNVAVEMPKFKVTASVELSKTLAGLGMPLAFTSEADFSGIDGRRDLYLSKVVHQVVVNLDEEGTEAAAATGVVMARALARRPMPPVVFRADHPFLYLIRDLKTGAILFLGRVADPTRLNRLARPARPG